MNIDEKLKALTVIKSILDCENAEQAALAVARSGIDVSNNGHLMLFLVDENQEQQWIELAMLIAVIERKSRKDVPCRDRSTTKALAENLAFLLSIGKETWMDRAADAERRFSVDPPRGMSQTWELTGDKSSFRQAVLADATALLNSTPEGWLPPSDEWA